MTVSVLNANDTKFYIDGAWVAPVTANLHDVINPATEQPAGQISLGSAADVDRAVAAARRAFPAYSSTSVEERIALLERIIEGLKLRKDELARAMTEEMGSPITFSTQVQFGMGILHFQEMIAVLKTYHFEQLQGNTMIRREAIGVCGLISPWNWPINQVVSKVAPALAAGCTMVLKPSEYSPLSTVILAEVFHEAGVPKGVFNLVNGDGPDVGEAISGHPDIDMVSFTGSTRAGILVAKAAAATVKRVTQELGGKSANVILSDADLATVIPAGVLNCYRNAGQSCQAPTRMLVHRSQRDTAVALAKEAATKVVLGDPLDPQTTMGPLVNKTQFGRVQTLIERGIQEGATLVCGGPGLPDGIDHGYYIKPTVFADVTPDMAIARDEIFGPVLSIMSYDNDDDAVKIANDTPYGLAGYVQSGDLEHARSVAARIRAGRIYINGTAPDASAPFGGYKQSGNGREVGVFGLEEYLEVKAVLGYRSA